MKKTLADLKAIRENMQSTINLRQENEDTVRVVVGMATCGIAAGARPVMATILEETKRRNLQNVQVSQTGCIGVCRLEPIVEIFEAGKEKVTYVKMTEDKARKIVAEHLANRRIVPEYTIGSEE